MRILYIFFLALSLLASCQSSQPPGLAEFFTGNTLQGKDYATWFPDSATAIMQWQGNTSHKKWWISEQQQFCHETDDGHVCEQVKRLENGDFEFCGRWGCFPAKLLQGNPLGMQGS